MDVELRDFEFSVDDREVFKLLDSFEDALGKPATETWPIVVCGMAFQYWRDYRWFVRDC